MFGSLKGRGATGIGSETARGAEMASFVGSMQVTASLPAIDTAKEPLKRRLGTKRKAGGGYEGLKLAAKIGF